MIGAGTLELSERERRGLPQPTDTLPVLVTEWVDGDRVDIALRKYAFTASEVVRLILRLAHALRYLHADQRKLHCDIRAGNIMVRRDDHEPVLIDFANAKSFDFARGVAKKEQTKLVIDPSLLPTGLPDESIWEFYRHGGTRLALYDLVFPGLDLYQTGLVLNDVLPLIRRVLAERDYDYVEALASQLTQWHKVQKWKVDELLDRASRLEPGFFAPFGVEELTTPAAASRTVMLPGGIPVPITARTQRIIDNRSFRRLSHLNQLSLVQYVYPGASYKRIVHVLHCYELARELVLQLYAHPMFRDRFDADRTRQLLLTVLLHDINHFPFLHTIQEVQGIEKGQILTALCGGELTGEVVKGEPSLYDLLSDYGIDQDRLYRLVLGSYETQSGPYRVEDMFISSLVNSGCDVDKMSYVFLDAYFTGVSYGLGVDYAALVKAATVIEMSGGLHLAFDERALQALEHLCFARYWNFKSIYWHHTNRAVMAMVMDVVHRLNNAKAFDFLDFIRETAWRDDTEAVRWLDARHTAVFEAPSVLHDLLSDRRTLFRRLYTVRPDGDAADTELYRQLDTALATNEGERRTRVAIAASLSDYLSTPSTRVTVTESDVLVDLPRRPLDRGGVAYVVRPSREVKELADISDAVKALNASFDRLTKRVRVFVSPWVADILSGRRTTDRDEIHHRLREAATDATSRDEVR